MGAKNHPYGDLDVESEFARRRDERAFFGKGPTELDEALEHIDEVRKFTLRSMDESFYEDKFDYLTASNHFNDAFDDAFEEFWQTMPRLNREEIDWIGREET